MLEIAQRNGESFLSDTIFLCQDLLTDILLTINSLDTFSAREEFIWNSRLADLMNSISSFVEITTLISKLIGASNKKLIAEVKESHIQLLFIMKGMIQAQQKQDIVALEELIKYELKDNLTMWKIDLIPQTKRSLNA